MNVKKTEKTILLHVIKSIRLFNSWKGFIYLLEFATMKKKRTFEKRLCARLKRSAYFAPSF